MINYPSTIGLFMDIIGVLLLFRYGLPSKFMEEPSLGIEYSSEEEIERNKFNRKIKFGAYTGLFFILVGFVFQLIGTNTGWINQYFK